MSQPPVLTPSTNGKDQTLMPPAGTAPPVDSEVVPRPQRRTFSADYKRRILHEADHCTPPGQIGALVRREGLYSSHLTTWRRQRERGELGTRKRGQPAADPGEKEVVRLRRENARLQVRLEQAETIIAVQKKLCSLLGLPCEGSGMADNR